MPNSRILVSRPRVHNADGVAVTDSHHFAEPREAEIGKSEEENQDRTDKVSHRSP